MLRGPHYGFTASNEMLFTPNFLLAPRALNRVRSPATGDAGRRRYGSTASNEMLFTPNFLPAPRALSEMNW